VSLGIVVASYGRPASLARLLVSIERQLPDARTLVIHQRCGGPPWVGALRRLGALVLCREVDVMLFLDDDHEVLPGCRTRLIQAVDALGTGTPPVGLVRFPLRASRRQRLRQPVALGGGMLVSCQSYDAVGGHGDDYLEDLELSIRMLLGRWAVLRWDQPLTRHHGGVAGGLRAVPGVAPKRTAHLRLSQLEQRYGQHCVRDPKSWWGYRFHA